MNLFGVLGSSRRKSCLMIILAGVIATGMRLSSLASNVTLAWDRSTDPMITGYNVYIGGASRDYTNLVDAGNSTSVMISNLAPGRTYYFAATTYSISGLESVYSSEAAYTVPQVTVSNQPPTLNLIADITINENAGTQTVDLSGISSGSQSEIQTLTVSAFSSKPSIIPNPTINYTSPNPNGILTFSPAANAIGTATITVMVDDGGVAG